MKKITFIIFLFFSVFSQAQQDSYRWRVGAHGGAMTYYGDLSKSYFDWQRPWSAPLDNLDKATYGLSIENNFSKTFSWKLSATQGSFQAYDRAIDRDGSFLTDVENFNRGLNVQTDIRNLAFTFQFYTDNDWLLSEKAVVAPFFSIGAGLTQFTPYADLFLENGNRYHYWSDGTIRNISELTLPPSAEIIERDQIFETNLTEVQTEQADYATTTLSFPIGVGLKFRLSDRLNLNLEAQGQYTMTDYLDDVSGNYPTNFDSPLQSYASLPGTSSTTSRGTDNGLNDIFGTITISAHYSFGYKMDAFLPPTFYTIDATPVQKNTTTPLEETTETLTLEDSLETITGEVDKTIKVISKGSTDEFSDENNSDSTVEVKVEQIITESDIKKTETVIIKESDDMIELVEDINQTRNLDTTITIIKTPTDTTVLVVIEEIDEKIVSTPSSDEAVITEEIIEKEVNETITITEQKGVVIVDLDGNPVLPDTTAALVEVPVTTTSDSTVSLAVVPDDDEPSSDFLKILEAMKASVDSTTVDSLSITEPTIDISDLNLMDSISIETAQNDSEVLYSLEQTRTELATLSVQFNQLLQEREADKAEIASLHEKLDSLTKNLLYAQQFNNNVAIRGNEDATTESKVDIQNSTNELEKELETMRTQLDRANSDYQKALEYAREQEIESQKRINTLNRKVDILKAQIKTERKKNRFVKDRLWNPARTESNNLDSNVDTTVIIIPRDSIVLDTISFDGTTDIDVDLENTLDSILTAIETENATTLKAKESEIDELRAKTKQMETDFQASKAEQDKAEKAKNEAVINELNAKLDALVKKMETLEKAEPKVITVEKPIEKIVEKPVEKVIEPPVNDQLTQMTNAIKGYETSNIYFQNGKSTVDREFHQRLEQIANLMLLYPELKATVTGYTDKSGNPDINFKLSRQRSHAVESYLKQQGVRQDRIIVNYFGSTKATKANDPFARRVEISLIY